MKYRKVFVEVQATFTEDGRILPNSIKWEDGTQYNIDRILAIQHRPALKVGGVGMRYRCRIQNSEAYLFLEENRWFVEAKVG